MSGWPGNVGAVCLQRARERAHWVKGTCHKTWRPDFNPKIHGRENWLPKFVLWAPRVHCGMSTHTHKHTHTRTTHMHTHTNHTHARTKINFKNYRIAKTTVVNASRKKVGSTPHPQIWKLLTNNNILKAQYIKPHIHELMIKATGERMCGPPSNDAVICSTSQSSSQGCLNPVRTKMTQ